MLTKLRFLRLLISAAAIAVLAIDAIDPAISEIYLAGAGTTAAVATGVLKYFNVIT